MRQAKNAKTQASIDRMRLYLRDNPTCNLRHASEVLGLSYHVVKKWKTRGYLGDMHMNAHEARALEKQAKLDQAAEFLGVEMPENPTKRTRTPKPAATPEPTKPARKQRQPSGEVASSSSAAPTTREMSEIEQLIAKGKDLKISQIRSLVKSHLMLSVSDSKAVANYAAGLKALSGVQDVELEDIYENEQLIKIYVPKEDAASALEIIEVAKIEY